MLPFIYREKQPAASLRSYIKCYWRFRRKFKPGKSQKIYPDSTYELIWVQSGTLLVDGIPAPRLFVGGMSEQPIVLSSDGTVEVWSVRFLPWGLVPFDGDIRSLTQTTSVDQVFSPADSESIAEIFRTSTHKDFAHNLDAYFLKKMLSGIADSRLQLIGRRMIAEGGHIDITRLAAECRVSRRQLERVIAKATGKGPREVASRLRFEYVRKALVHTPNTSLSMLAHDYGYADQSHLHKEFQQYTNLTPRQYAKEFVDIYGPLLGRD